MQANKLLTVNECVIQVVGVAVCWTVLYNLNWELFERTAMIPGVNLVFLPAMIRTIAALSFGIPGVIGLGVGSILTATADHLSQPVVKIAIGLLINMVGPLLAVHVGKKIMQVPDTLIGLTYKHIVVFSVLVAAANSVFHSIGYWIVDDGISMKGFGFAMFIGDVAGAVMMLGMLSLTLRAWERIQTNHL